MGCTGCESRGGDEDEESEDDVDGEGCTEEELNNAVRQQWMIIFQKRNLV